MAGQRGPSPSPRDAMRGYQSGLPPGQDRPAAALAGPSNRSSELRRSGERPSLETLAPAASDLGSAPGTPRR